MKGQTFKEKLIVICGPTASGKSDLAVVIAKKVNGEIISADSRQVYKGMDIGTGKITKREMKGVPHHLLDIITPAHRYTVKEFKEKAEQTIDEIVLKKKIPLLCGGTGFYIEAVVDNVVFPDVPPNSQLRKKLGTQSADSLLQTLKKLDPKRAATIDPQNKVRIIRAIEIATTLGSVPSVKKAPRYDTLMIGIGMPDSELRERILKRLLKRIRHGMIDEVRRLHRKGVSWKRMEELGLEYRSIAHFLQGKITKKEMIEQLSFDIWHYAKRQITWFKRDKRIEWYSPSAEELILRRVKNFLREK